MPMVHANKALEVFPPVPAVLLEALERQYPARCIRPDETPEAAHRYAGKVELIQWLRRQSDKRDPLSH